MPKCTAEGGCFAKELSADGEVVCKALNKSYPTGLCPFQKEKATYKVPKSWILSAYKKVEKGGYTTNELQLKYDKTLQLLRKKAIKKYHLLQQ